MPSLLLHTHAFRCSRPGPAPIYLASQPTVTGTVNTARISFLGCALRTARLNDNCRPHPNTVAEAPYHPHTRPPDVRARLAYQRSWRALTALLICVDVETGHAPRVSLAIDAFLLWCGEVR